MINNTLQMLAGGLTLLTASCPIPDAPQAPQAPQPKPPCATSTIILESFEQETDCNLTPPQVLAVRISDPNDVLTCNLHGGVPMIDEVAGTAYCINLDY